MKITLIIGTRPELIKVAPIIWAIRKSAVEYDIVNTAQHKELLDPYWRTLEIEPSYVLDVMRPGQDLSSLTSRAITQIQSYLDEINIKPDILLAQGDTTTVMAASMVAFYNKIKFAHLEAGLRSFDMLNPFPEEYNRKIASISADFHLCPTNNSRDNLLNEGIEKEKVFVVGNTVIDSLQFISSKEHFLESDWINNKLHTLDNFQHSVLITCHRRENHGEKLLNIIEAVEELAGSNKDTAFVWVLHPNPNVKTVVEESRLSDCDNVILVDPLDYLDVLRLLKTSICAISDSGGIQEEAPSFKTPVLVLRKRTERPEGVEAGLAFLVDTDKEKIKSTFEFVKRNQLDFQSNPYGDGKSGQRVLDIILKNSH